MFDEKSPRNGSQCCQFVRIFPQNREIVTIWRKYREPSFTIVSRK